MCTDIIENPSAFIDQDKGILTTTSKVVAQAFGKRPAHVNDKIERLNCSDEFRYANFSAYPERDGQNKKSYTVWRMTKDGFMFLVMGFTGKRAAAIKEAYINAFNQMAAQLQGDISYETGQLSLNEPQIEMIQLLINRRVQQHDNYASIHGAIRKEFGVSSYKRIASTRIGELISFIDEYTVKKLPVAVSEPSAQTDDPDVDKLWVEFLQRKIHASVMGLDDIYSAFNALDAAMRKHQSAFVSLKTVDEIRDNRRR